MQPLSVSDGQTRGYPVWNNCTTAPFHGCSSRTNGLLFISPVIQLTISFSLRAPRDGPSQVTLERPARDVDVAPYAESVPLSLQLDPNLSPWCDSAHFDGDIRTGFTDATTYGQTINILSSGRTRALSAVRAPRQAADGRDSIPPHDSTECFSPASKRDAGECRPPLLSAATGDSAAFLGTGSQCEVRRTISCRAEIAELRHILYL